MKNFIYETWDWHMHQDKLLIVRQIYKQEDYFLRVTLISQKKVI